MGNEALWTQSLEERDTRLRPFFSLSVSIR